MFLLAITISIALMVMACGHILLPIAFARFLRRASSSSEASDSLPPVAVLMAVRGADPFLETTIRSLSELDYPDFQVSIIVDHRTDPGWSICHQVVDDLNVSHISIHELTKRLDTCSLKCSALAQAVDELSGDREVIVLADADVVPHKNWLRELVAPLSDPEVGIATGNQWFIPRRANPGSLVRSVWNAGAILPTTMLGHPWAGSCALRVKDVRQSGLVERWRQSIVDDGPIASSLKTLGRKVRFVPSIVMLNREQCELRFCRTYLRRMLTWSRLFESTYPLTLLHAVLLQGVSLLGVIAAVICGLSDQWSIAGLLLGAICVFWIANLMGFVMIDRAIRRHAAVPAECWPSRSWRHWLGVVLAIPLTHFLYALAAIEACFVRHVEWRDVTYRIESGGRVKMLSYAPYRSVREKRNAELSV